MVMDVASTGEDVSSTQNRWAGTGNRLALAGAILYFLEWVVIIPAGGAGPAALGTKAAAIVSLYATHAGAQEFMASWFSLVLLGRIVFVAGVRSALQRSPRELPLADVALAAMTVSVLLEIAAYAVAASAGYLAGHSGPTAAIVGLDGSANWLDQIIWAPLGLSVATSAFAMLRSAIFPRWLCWLGLVSGLVSTAYGALAGPAFVSTGGAQSIVQAANGIGALSFWIWMLATGILLFRRA
jgi:hypothetical protein